MIKRTLLFENPVYLSTKNQQLIVAYPNQEKPNRSVPIEDIGMVILEHRQITISNALTDYLIQNNVAIVHCNAQHMPIGLTMHLNGHTEHSERFQLQLNTSVPLKKNMWQQVIKAKIKNQAELLTVRNRPSENMLHWASEVQSGDAMNHEARAAAYYWGNLFDLQVFKRGRFEPGPNPLLNYGYAILRAICARSLLSSGLLPIMGIHHKSKYNAYCLADDMMEAYRPFVDYLVCQVVDNHDDHEELTPNLKKHMLQIPVMDVVLEGKKSPLLVGMSRTTNSLYECYAGVRKKLVLPSLGLTNHA